MTASPRLSILIPAHDEAGHIAACLRALLASDPVPGGAEVIVAANGCSDATVAEARAVRPLPEGWRVSVLDLPTPGKTRALTAAEARARGAILAYLDADVIVSPPLCAEIATALDRPDPAYASGRVTIPEPQSAVSRLYARFYREVPFFHAGVPGCGLFAMTRAGRARWGDWPDIISDDTFARLMFTPSERHAVPAPYSWPVVEGWAALVRVRRRQDAGVAEIARLYPGLIANDDPRPGARARLLRAAARRPVSATLYAAVRLAARLGRAQGWARGR
ncbi:MAG: glycosyltransferase [Roseovarius sp.]|nr:glycosyltransferase [Roseovarius sp.]